MPQFRLTAKFAKDIKVEKLENPADVVPVVDDWVIDVIRINRKKAALITHFSTKISFIIPYVEVGGAKTIPDWIPIIWKAWLFDEGLSSLAQQIDQVFSGPIIFCKTNDRNVLGHMNDFKRSIECMVAMGDDLNEISSRLHKTPMKCKNGAYSTPIELLRIFAGT